MSAPATSTKKSSPVKAKKAPSSKAAAHPKYEDMVKAAILTLKDRKGSSRQAIKKYVVANYPNLGANHDSQINTAIKRGVDKGFFNYPKGPSGTVKLTKPTTAEKSATKEVKPSQKKAADTAAVKAKKPAASAKPKATTAKATTAKAKTATKKPAEKKEKIAKKPATTKKAAGVKKPAAKKAAAKPKASKKA